MNAGLAKVKPFTGLFLEALMLVVIIACVQSNITPEKVTDDSPAAHHLAVIQQFVGAFDLYSHTPQPVLTRHQNIAGVFSIFRFNPTGSKMVLNHARNIARADINNFYIHLTGHAP